MGIFLEQEKVRLTAFRASSPYFSDAARADGSYRGKLRSFCLPRDCAEENLFPCIRQSAPAYFAANKIKWHDGQDYKPSNHLCDSQVCCVNFLFPFAHEPTALRTILQCVFPTIKQMLPVEDGQYVAFEWIGAENYLGERVRKGSKRTRGANFTSADAIVLFERTDGMRQAVLIEWKYTESYSSNSLHYAKSGTDRTLIYKPLFERNDCPINKGLLACFESQFYEPFYQLMRQQFLAHEMELAHELGANQVSVLHISPAHNKDFDTVTSPDLRNLGDKATDVWKRLVQPQDRFISISTEQLFGHLSPHQLCGMSDWLAYIDARYPWVNQ